MTKITDEKWFKELHPQMQAKLRKGHADPFGNIRFLYNLSPAEIRRACESDEFPGMQLYAQKEDEKAWNDELDALLLDAAWLYETMRHCTFLDELIQYKFVRHYGGKPVLVHWNRDGQMVHQTINDFKNSHIDRYVVAQDPDTGVVKRIAIAGVYLKSPKIKRYESAEFLPGKTEHEIPDDVLNLWRGWPLRDDLFDHSPYEPIDCKLFLEHIFYNLCQADPEVYNYLLGWMSDAIINVHRTSEVAVVLRGPQGSGKTLWAKCFMQLFGKNYTLTLDKPDQVTGSHNKHLQDKCIIFADEAFFAGNRQHAATLKTLVTSNEIFVHPKFVDGFMAPKRFRVIIASNDEHVIRAEEDDRRYLVLDVDAGEHNQDGEYFGAIMDEWNSGGKQALFRWLRGNYWRNKLDTGEWDVRDRPQTKALQKQKELSLSETQAIVQQMLAAGELPNLYAHDAATETVFVSTRVLAERNRLKAKDETALGKFLRVLAGPEAENVRVYLDEGHNRRQYRGYWLPSLPECRQRWENHLNRLIEWPDDVRSWGFEVKPDDIPF